MINTNPERGNKIFLIGLAFGSFIVGTRILYIFQESQRANLMINIVICGIGLVVAIVSLLYAFKNNDEVKN